MGPCVESTTTSQTNASNFWSPMPTQTTTPDFISPPAHTGRTYNFTFAPNDLPNQLKPDYQTQKNQLPFTAFHNPGDIKVGRKKCCQPYTSNHLCHLHRQPC